MSHFRSGFRLSTSAHYFFTGSVLVFAVLLLFLLFALGPVASAKGLSYSPVHGHLTSDFGWRKDPYTGKSRFHAGLDIAAKSGTPIYVPQKGVVVYSGAYKGYGNIVVVQHQADVYTLYGHTSQYFVRPGQPVYKGQVIALVGSTGRSTGPHLHFEVRQNKGYVNPKDYLSYLEQRDQSGIQTAVNQGSQNSSKKGSKNQGVGGPELPAYSASSSTPQKKSPYRPGDVQGNAIQAQRYRSSPSYSSTVGRTIQVISGTEVKLVRF